MRRAFSIVIISVLIMPLAFAQEALRGKVISSQNGEPLAFVNILVNNKQYGTTTDIDGYFTIPGSIPLHNLRLSYIGFETLEYDVPSSLPRPWVIELKPNTYLLQEIELTPGVNPAHRMIKAAVERKKENEPTALSSFDYDSYNKFIVRLNTDSVSLPDTIQTPDDSSTVEAIEFSEKQHFFLMEAVTHRSYIKGKRDHEEVLASRVSGLQDPTFVLLANQLQSFSFYDDYIKVLDRNYLNPISQNSWNKYVFILEDTIIRGADSSFIISYRPSVKSNFDGLRGRLTISTQNWAIENVTAEPAKDAEMKIRIYQKYEQKEGGAWFPVQLYTDIDLLQASFNGLRLVAEGRTYLKDIRIEPELEKGKIPNVDMTLDPEATSRSDDFWNTYRVDTLSRQDKETYRVIDSIGKAENLDTKLKGLQALITGKVRTGKVDWDINRVLSVNTYEAVRLGVGAHTNERLWRYFLVGGYAGYGFKDKGWKYGGDMDWTLSPYRDIHWKIRYDKDIPESGNTEFLTDPWINPINSLRLLAVENRDQMERLRTSFSFRPRANMVLEVGTQFQTRSRIQTYEFLGDAAGSSSNFRSGEFLVNWKWSPNSKYMQTSYGLVSMKSEYPVIQLQYTQGLDGYLDGEFDYSRVDIRIDHRWRIRNAGQLFLTLMGGYIDADLPASFLYNGMGNRGNIISDVESFETMSSSIFLSDTRADILLRHHFGKLFRKPGFQPEFSLVARAAYGSLRSPESHQAPVLRTLEKGYYEAGFIISKIFSTTGIGVYYRLGHYSEPEWTENVTVKFHFSLDFLR